MGDWFNSLGKYSSVVVELVAAISLLAGGFFAFHRWGYGLITDFKFLRNLRCSLGNVGVEPFHRIAHHEALLQILAYRAGVGVYSCSVGGDCVWVSEALSELFGLHPDEMVANGWLAAVHPEDRHRVYASWKYAVENKLPYEDTYRVVVKDATFHVRTEADAVRYGNTVIGFMGCVERV